MIYLHSQQQAKELAIELLKFIDDEGLYLEDSKWDGFDTGPITHKKLVTSFIDQQAKKEDKG